MLAVAAAVVRDTTKDGSHGCGGIMSESTTATVNSFSFNPEEDEFPDLGDGNLLESIDFDDLFAGINDGDVLPDLEMDPEILAEFSASGGEESSGKSTTEDNSNYHHQRSRTEEEEEEEEVEEEEDHHQTGDKLLVFGSGKGDEIVNSKRDRGSNSKRANNYEKGRKSSSGQSTKNNNQGKRKVKVDWTPELHRRFVQAVEQLGVDKAVPSRILDLMGIDCLTRHNIASHLQKYRSHRKHLLAREAEAASWTQRRQMYGSAVAGGGGAAGKRSEMPRWMGPAMGFPPPAMHFRPPPLHVWGHPSVDQTLLHVWPKHLTHPSPPPPAAWIPTRPPPHPSFWHPHGPVPNGPSPGTPCFPQAIPAATRIGAAAAAGVPPQQQLQVPTGQMGPHPPPFDPQPWKESIDEAIGDVLSKPWQALPLGLKPPSIDSVMVELQRQGVPKVPPNPNTNPPPPCASPLLNSTTSSSSSYD